MAHPLADLGFQPEIVSEDSSPGMLESAGRGALQSASFGTADELTGAAEAGIDVLRDPAKLQEYLDLYRKYRDESRQAYKTAQEANPMSYFGGELAGAFVPGVGMAGGVAKGASALAKIASAAKTGAKVGGAYAAGASEADLTHIPEEGLAPAVQLAKETGTGALAGGVIGGGLTAVGQGIKGTANYAHDRSEFVQNLIESFKRGKAGEELAGTIGREQAEKSVNKAAEDIREQLQNEISRGSQLKTSAIESAEEAGAKTNVEDIIKKYQDKIEKLPTASEEQLAEKETLQNLLNDFKAKVTERDYSKYGEEKVRELGPKELNELIEPFKQSSALGKEALETAQGSKTATDITRELKGAQRTTGGETAQDYFNAQDIAQGDKIMSAALKAKELLFPALSGLTDAEKIKMEAKLANTIRELQQNTEGGVSARHFVEEALIDLEKTNPDLVKSIRERMLDRATAYDLAKKMGAESSIQGSLVGTVQGKILGASNVAGGLIKKIGESRPGQFAKTIKGFISGSTPESLQEVRAALVQKGDNAAIKDLDAKLAAAQEAPSQSARNALLFAIMQTSAYRNMLGINNE